ncbi:LOW QUALITY PROTEIN: capZ-interacting protein [Artibeus jamaicensis]|uniref:LOW QUALITY PROTEIN: capZ-interacting protein n=1 Tax=Artibeus jamaicensis TaxID=9417 RepID=UPI00235B2E67|nr:LOW QUALITY PROTEIN: capZ-interacting protein [Artibeus jamaicensis]
MEGAGPALQPGRRETSFSSPFPLPLPPVLAQRPAVPQQPAGAHLPCAGHSPGPGRQAGRSENGRTVSPGGRAEWHLGDMEDRPSEANANVDTSASPSVAQLAGRFREQAAAAKEIPASKPARRKPPCSLPLFPPRVELGQNGEEKSPPNSGHFPKVKVKSSPLIEKLQANLAFDPTALLPGASPKSPGLKAAVSPFHSPPSTPSSPGVRPQAGEPEEVPISFDQPPEGSRLPCCNKVRTRGSIKRRPPSRRFRRSQSDCGELGDFRVPEPSQENGAQEDAGDQVFLPKSKAPGSPPPSEGVRGVHGKPPLRRTSSRTERQEEQAQAPKEDLQPEKAPGDAKEGEAEPCPTTSTEAENGAGSPSEERPATEQEASTAEVKEEGTGGGEEPSPPSAGTKRLEEGAVAQETPQNPAGGVEGSLTPEEGKGQEKQEEGAVPEPGCTPTTGSEAPETEISERCFRMMNLSGKE